MEGGTKNIIINTADFQIKQGGRSTRKRIQDSDSTDHIEELRVRAPVRQRKQTVRNNNTLLKFIRRHQEEKRRKLLEDEFRSESAGDDRIGREPYNTSIGHINDDSVEEALEYLLKLPEKMKEDRIHGGSGLGNQHIVTNENVSMVPPFHTDNIRHPIASTTSLPAPYNNMDAYVTSSIPIYNRSISGLVPTIQNEFPSTSYSLTNPIQNNSVVYENKDIPAVGADTSEYMDGGSDNIDQERVRLKYVKQKRTKQRTFRVGKSKDIRNVGVLVSNRTIRKGITTKKQLMKQTPIHEIRKYLVKHGLIKVGTTAPNEVLRKMYETSQLMCGELYNHNTDILLHNFMNDDHA